MRLHCHANSFVAGDSAKKIFRRMDMDTRKQQEAHDQCNTMVGLDLQMIVCDGATQILSSCAG